MPTEPKVTRKLRAILSADVKGYSILMADDEVHTIQTLIQVRSTSVTDYSEARGCYYRGGQQPHLFDRVEVIGTGSPVA